MGVRRWLAKNGDLTLLVVGVVIVQFLPTHLEGDGLSRYQAIEAIARGQSLAGARYPVWGSLGSLPLYGLGRVIGHPRLLTAHYNGLLLALGVLGLGLAVRGTVPTHVRNSFLLLVVGGSMFAAHAEEFYGEVFTALAVGIGTIIVVRRPRWSSWVPILFGVANTPAAAPALVALVAWRCTNERRLRWILAIFATAGLIIIDAAARHRSLLFGSYVGDHGEVTLLPYSGRPGFSFPVLLGIAAILFAFGKGLLFFIPSLFVSLTQGVQRRLKEPALETLRGWVLFTAVLVVVYGGWWAWDGGFFWGPRFFLIACLPAALALAVLLEFPPSRSTTRLAVLGLLGACAYVAVNGATLQSRQAFLFCQAHAVSVPFLCSDVPEFSPLWRPFLDRLHPTAAQWAFAVWVCVVAVRLAVPTLRLLTRAGHSQRIGDGLSKWTW